MSLSSNKKRRIRAFKCNKLNIHRGFRIAGTLWWYVCRDCGKRYRDDTRKAALHARSFGLRGNSNFYYICAERNVGNFEAKERNN